MHLLVDSTGLKLCGAGGWLLEKHGTRTRLSWRKLHIGADAGTGWIVTAMLSASNVDDTSQVDTLLDQTGPLAPFTADAAYDQEGVYGMVAKRSSESAVIVPLRSNAVPIETASSAPVPRDRHLRYIAEHVRGRQKVPGCHWRALCKPTSAGSSA